MEKNSLKRTWKGQVIEGYVRIGQRNETGLNSQKLFVSLITLQLV